MGVWLLQHNDVHFYLFVFYALIDTMQKLLPW